MKWKHQNIFRSVYFYFLFATLLFHLYLMLMTLQSDNHILSAVLFIPVGIFGYKLTSAIMKYVNKLH